ncbi:uncharacterized protein LOC125212700 isoform X1 [Salvia hispanica]|uniref:uncharacterized protein LOC125212700 isoform X1 n=1 Tax=Salvia hispanica TaxID=49212 RepID=UPI002008FC89|nr:uncharacterized protein LOC125212700 isoform X1 [Salvia hispanica]
MISTHQNLITSSLFLILFLSLHSLFETCDAKCTPFCGIIHNISSPFRLNTDPKKCGRYALACENNVTSISLNSHQYYVKAINYTGYGDEPTIRVVDASINKDDICSFPTFAIYAHSFIHDHPNPIPYLENDNSLPINFISCPNPLRNTSLFTDITTRCVSYSSHHHKYAYIKVGHMKASEVPYTCGVDLIAMTSWHNFKDLNNVSLSEIHESLLYGYELTICPWCDGETPSKLGLVIILVVVAGLLCAAVSPPLFFVCGFGTVSLLVYLLIFLLIHIHSPEADQGSSMPSEQWLLVIGLLIFLPRFILFPLAFWLFISKFRRRHLSEYNTIESFLQSDNKLSPI